MLDSADLALFDDIARTGRDLAEQVEQEIGRIMYDQVERAQGAGVLRSDVDVSDVAALMRAADGGPVDRRDRRVAVLLQGLRAADGHGG
ncbi:hypothetical protein ACIBF1_18405 [Spirillospora sp. NPDC050679]